MAGLQVQTADYPANGYEGITGYGDQVNMSVRSWWSQGRLDK